MVAPRITKEELKAGMERPEGLLILDVRSSGDYDASGKRIPGALRVPLGELEDRLGEFGQGRQIVAYCS